MSVFNIYCFFGVLAVGTFFRILYAGWLGFCVLVFILSLSMAHQVSFFGSLFMTFLLAITPYYYLLCIFKIPIDFEVWCIHHNHNMNDFILFFKKYWLYYIFLCYFLLAYCCLKWIYRFSYSYCHLFGSISFCLRK